MNFFIITSFIVVIVLLVLAVLVFRLRTKNMLLERERDDALTEIHRLEGEIASSNTSSNRWHAIVATAKSNHKTPKHRVRWGKEFNDLCLRVEAMKAFDV